jgi:hypothetical protein
VALTAAHAVVLLAAFVGGAYGLGEFFGKSVAFMGGLDRGYWSDFGAVAGGAVGGGFWIGWLVGMVISG